MANKQERLEMWAPAFSPENQVQTTSNSQCPSNDSNPQTPSPTTKAWQYNTTQEDISSVGFQTEPRSAWAWSGRKLILIERTRRVGRIFSSSCPCFPVINRCRLPIKVQQRTNASRTQIPLIPPSGKVWAISEHPYRLLLGTLLFLYRGNRAWWLWASGVQSPLVRW